jgi:hypothetical protein
MQFLYALELIRVKTYSYGPFQTESFFSHLPPCISDKFRSNAFIPWSGKERPRLSEEYGLAGK